MSRVAPERQYSSLGVCYTASVMRSKYLFHEKRSLEKYYASNPWPYNKVLMEIASQLDMSFENVYKWFAMRRARAIGLKSGVVDTVPNVDECPSVMSWRIYVAEFGDEQYRANAIHALQHPMTPSEIQLESTSWRKGLEPPAKEPRASQSSNVWRRQYDTWA